MKLKRGAGISGQRRGYCSGKPLLLLEFVAVDVNVVFYLFGSFSTYQLAEEKLREFLDNQTHKLLEDYQGIKVILHCTSALVLNLNLLELQIELILSGFNCLEIELDKELMCYTNLQLIKQLPKTFWVD